MTTQPQLFNTKVPPTLATVKDAIGVGVYYLALGKRPKAEPPSLPAGECTPVRIALDGTALEVYPEARKAFDSDRQTIIHALQLVSELPELARSIKF